MATTLGITIKGCSVPDTAAKCIAYLIYGLDYSEIALVTGIAEGTIRNSLCTLRGYLKVENNYELLSEAHTDGFEFNGHVNGIDILSPYERKHLFDKVPRLKLKRHPPTLVFKAA